MKVIKRILKVFVIFLFAIIPIILISYNVFVGFMGCYLIINNDNNELESLLIERELSENEAKVIFIDTIAGDGDHITIINKNLSIKDSWICIDDEDNKLGNYIIENGIDVYDLINKLSYIYIIVIAAGIFFKKLTENVDKFGKFEERDN